ncbi:MAG: hypothetical protein IJQ65_07325 [Kiritimatiellae bacterium]|nr:hypothetical protein [Kiritimatiellia bacterium]
MKVDFAPGRMIAMLFASVAFAMHANAIVVKQTVNGNNDKGLSDSTLWGEAPDSTNDYIAVKASLYVSSSQNNNTFNGKSLQIGVVGGAATIVYNYANGASENRIAKITGEGGLALANGSWLTRYGGTTISYVKAETGGITVTSPASAPFRFGNYTTRCGGTIDLYGKLSGASTTGILVKSDPCSDADFANYPVALRVNGDVADFLGSVVVSNSSSGGAEFRLSGSASYFGGSVLVRAGATFAPEITTSVNQLSLESGAALSLVAGGTLAVRTSLSIENPPLALDVSGLPSSDVIEVTRYALITMPASSVYTEADFTLPNYGSSTCTAPDLKMEVNGNTKTLYATYYPVVTLVVRNNTAIGDTEAESAVGVGSYWSDDEPAHGSAHYQVNRLNVTTGLTLPYDLEGTNTFPGTSLKMSNATQLQLRTGDYTISNLTFSGNSGCTIYGLDGYAVTLRGIFSTSGRVSFAARKGGTIKMVGPISGTSESILNICGAAAGTGQCRGIVVLDGDNSGYAGKMQVTLDYPGNLRFADQFMSIRVSDSASLGGARAEFAYDALKIENAGRLEAYDSFTLDEPTRGVFISGQGRFYVAAEKTMTLKEQLTVNGRAYKEGSGTLALGGALRYLDGTGAVTDVPPAHATNRTFYVTGGRVKPLTADALEGLYVVFSNKTSKLDVGLAMDVAPADATLLAKGICNTNSSAPFAWQSDEASPKITIRLDCADETPRQNYEFAVMTLSRDVADGVFDSVRFTLPDGFRHYGVTTTRTYDAEANTATLHATLEQRGIMLILR